MTDEIDDDEIVETKDEGPWIVCPVCEGNGTTVNPDIDGNGLSADDFNDDPDFREDYANGVYDIQCRCCKGLRVVKEGRMEELRQAAADRELSYREDGVYDPSYNPRDYRYGDN